MAAEAAAAALQSVYSLRPSPAEQTQWNRVVGTTEVQNTARFTQGRTGTENEHGTDRPDCPVLSPVLTASC